MSKLATAPCPNCGMPGTLSITMKFIARPLGTFSLSGQQMKVAAEERPVLGCSNCPYEVVGRLDGRHAVFDVGATS
jgi:hypothetical protein